MAFLPWSLQGMVLELGEADAVDGDMIDVV
jgi:hypothetical protein